MKKLLVLVLALAAALALTACGASNESAQEPVQEEAAQTFTGGIPVGDGVADIDITGACYGETYTLVDPMESTELAEDDTGVKTYYCENCDTPYIEVYDTNKGDMTLEDFTKRGAETYGNGYYQMLDGCGYYTAPWEDGGNFYYISNLTYEGDEQFHTVCYSAKTEEIHIADNVYMWVPTGYTKKDFDHLIPVFGCSYEESYALPNFAITGDDGSYENMMNYYSFNGENNITEEQYKAWSENWTDENTAAFYEAVGFKVVTTLEKNTDAGSVWGVILDNQRNDNANSGIAYVTIGDIDYRINLWCQGDMPSYPYLYTAICSIHTK